MSTALEADVVRWEVEVDTGSVRTRYAFDRFSRAIQQYHDIDTHGGAKKRLVRIKKGGTRVVVAHTVTGKESG